MLWQTEPFPRSPPTISDPGRSPLRPRQVSTIDFLIDRKGTDCVLTLFGRQKGLVSYTNNVTYLATEGLPDCTCAE